MNNKVLLAATAAVVLVLVTIVVMTMTLRSKQRPPSAPAPVATAPVVTATPQAVNQAEADESTDCSAITAGRRYNCAADGTLYRTVNNPGINLRGQPCGKIVTCYVTPCDGEEITSDKGQPGCIEAVRFEPLRPGARVHLWTDPQS